MEEQIIETTTTSLLSEERLRLIQFCARFTKNREIAEDLAQETLFEAWRKQHTLRDPQQRRSWLFGIAHNICLRWLRTYRHDAEHLIQRNADQDLFLPDLADVLADDVDIEIALERKELIALLDRAITRLPAETRTVLIQRYVEESPLAEIAARLGTNTSAVAMRLRRGKLSLRRVLTQEMRQEMSDYIAHPVHDIWEETPLWCYICGQRRLLGQQDSVVGKFLIKCPACSAETDEILNMSNHLPILRGIRGYKRLYTRLAAWCDHYYRTSLRDGSIACALCGWMAVASITTPANFPGWLRNQADVHMWMSHDNKRVVALQCEHCLSASITTLESLVLEATPAQQFLQAHPRIRTLPRRSLEVDGRAALLTRFESVTDSARLDIISDEETYELLHIYGGPL
jgi:RNA polymerase sigma factor (sigma-70 family)